MSDYPTVAFSLGAGYIDDAKVNALALKVDALAQKAIPTKDGESELYSLARINLLDLIMDADGDQITDDTGDTYIADVPRKAHVAFYTKSYGSDSDTILLGPDNKTPATIDEVLSAYFAGGVHVFIYQPERFYSSVKIDGFVAREDNDFVLAVCGSLNFKIVGATSEMFFEKFNRYFAGNLIKKNHTY